MMFLAFLIIVFVGLSAIEKLNGCSDVTQQKVFQTVRNFENSVLKAVMQQASKGNEPQNFNWDSYIKYFRLADAVSEAFRQQGRVVKVLPCPLSLDGSLQNKMTHIFDNPRHGFNAVNVRYFKVNFYRSLKIQNEDGMFLKEVQVVLINGEAVTIKVFDIGDQVYISTAYIPK